jgi:hypothetical protein
MPFMSAQQTQAPLQGGLGSIDTAKPPARHGQDLAKSRAMARRLKTMIAGSPEPTAQQWNALGQAHWRGDHLADELVAWMMGEGMAQAWPLFEQALSTGVDATMPMPLRAYIQAVSSVPTWVNPAQMVRGARLLQATGLHGMMVLRDAGLMSGYQASAINQTLVMTGALHQGAQRRVAETTAWWLACTADGGMSPGGEGYKSTVRVRVMHALVRYRLSRAPKWDVAQLGLPINQVDMQATYLAFSVVQLLALRMTGVLVSRRESAAVMHLWRYIGWLMGVDDALLCDDEREGRVLLYRNIISQAPSDESSVLLGRALMDEPLFRHYRWGAAWWGPFNKARHLSLVRWFVGPQGMRNLGLPRSWPWYPLLMFVPMMMGSAVLHTIPLAARLWRRWARHRQVSYLGILLRGQRAPHQSPKGQPL